MDSAVAAACPCAVCDKLTLDTGCLTTVLPQLQYGTHCIVAWNHTSLGHDFGRVCVSSGTAPFACAQGPYPQPSVVLTAESKAAAVAAGYDGAALARHAHPDPGSG